MSNKQVIEVTEDNFDSLIASDVTLVDALERNMSGGIKDTFVNI